MKSLLAIIAAFLIHVPVSAHNLYKDAPISGFGMNQDDDGKWIDLQRFAEVTSLQGFSACQAPVGGRLFRGGAPNFGGFIEGRIPLQADPNALATLKSHNIGLVVDLRSPSKHLDHPVANAIDDMYPTSTADEEAVLIANHINYINISIPQGDHVPHADDTTLVRIHRVPETSRPEIIGGADDLNIYDAFRATIDTIRAALASGINVYVHCVHGADRTGTVIALFRSCTDAEREFGLKDFNLKIIQPAQDNFGGHPYLALGGLYHNISTQKPGADYLRALAVLKGEGLK